VHHICAKLASRNVLKFTCFGKGPDDSPKSTGGLCNHPCNARPGCQYQSSFQDVNQYDTTIKIPYNLPAGRYTLQWAAIVGNETTPYYSCSKLQIVESGLSSVSCKSPPARNPKGAISRLGCQQVNKRQTRFAPIVSGVTFGDFCYVGRNRSRAGLIDDDIDVKPVNAGCDPRVSCALAAFPDQCQAAFGATQDSCKTQDLDEIKKPTCSVKPIECSPIVEPGSSCNFTAGFSQCSGSNYVQCIHGRWRARGCGKRKICNSLSPGAGFVNCRIYRPGFDKCPPFS
jgi:hypothetical protein